MIFVITSDIDFVSDEVIKEAYKDLHDIPLTIFQTHFSNYLNNINNKLWEYEIHPNFCENSTQGNNFKEIVNNLDKIPNKKLGIRCHRYYTNNDIEEYYKSNNYLYLSNICTDLEIIKPFKMRNGLIQFPIFMEDGGYLKYHGAPKLESILSYFKEEGIYVFNFHPIHLALNSNDFNYIRKIKDTLSSKEYQNMDKNCIKKFKNNNYGIKDFLNDLLDYAKKNNIKLMTLEDCYYEL